MIIKMETENGRQLPELAESDGNGDGNYTKEVWKGGWRFVDGLENVEYHTVSGYPNIPLDQYDETFLNVARNVGFPTSAIITASRGDKSVIIGSNLSVYLLNDNGKTIERLN